MLTGKGKAALCVLAIAAAAFCAGCPKTDIQDDAPYYGESRGDVTLYRDMEFQDIPIPEGYALVQRESHSFQGSQSRSGVFVYEGTLEWTHALDFYRRQMPATGWAQIAAERGFDFRELRFRKGQEQVIVVVRQIRNGSRAELQLDNVQRNDLLLKGMLPAD